MKSWIDKDGFIHTKEFPSVDQSENGPMFTGLLSVFENGRDRAMSTISIWSINDRFRANRNREFGSHFSHDNMTGLYCLNKNRTGGVSVALPTARWNGRWWLHPRDVFFYFWCHNPRIGLFFLWISSLAMIISCIQKYKVRNGVKYIKTDGKLLAFLRCRSFDLKITYAICTFFIERHKYFDSWNDVAKRYFKEEGHPLRSLIC